ncbi:MAG TPA: hypothetical protein VNN20_06475 [Thermodesulfobacteriota bacterium]|nr:hypothetical protein [Thermodesulfobacteriota bacterium]
MPEGRRGSVIFSPTVSAPKPAGLIDAISEIQQYYIIEKTGQDIPPEFLTIRGVLTFFTVGFKNGLVEGLLLGLFLPLAWGVWEGKIPVFGGIQHDLFTRLFVFILGFGISVSIMVLFGIILAKYYIGNLTRRAVDALVWGRAASLTFKGILIFGVIYVALLFWTPENVWWVAEHIWKSNPEGLYYKVLGMKQAVWMAAWMQLLISPLLSVIPFLCLKSRKKLILKESN